VRWFGLAGKRVSLIWNSFRFLNLALDDGVFTVFRISRCAGILSGRFGLIFFEMREQSAYPFDRYAKGNIPRQKGVRFSVYLAISVT
jgi:hypothetical protein